MYLNKLNLLFYNLNLKFNLLRYQLLVNTSILNTFLSNNPLQPRHTNYLRIVTTSSLGLLFDLV